MAKQRAKNVATEIKEIERKKQGEKKHNNEILALKRTKQLHMVPFLFIPMKLIDFDSTNSCYTCFLV